MTTIRRALQSATLVIVLLAPSGSLAQETNGSPLATPTAEDICSAVTKAVAAAESGFTSLRLATLEETEYVTTFATSLVPTWAHSAKIREGRAKDWTSWNVYVIAEPQNQTEAISLQTIAMIRDALDGCQIAGLGDAENDPVIKGREVWRISGKQVEIGLSRVVPDLSDFDRIQVSLTVRQDASLAVPGVASCTVQKIRQDAEDYINRQAILDGPTTIVAQTQLDHPRQVGRGVLNPGVWIPDGIDANAKTLVVAGSCDAEFTSLCLQLSVSGLYSDTSWGEQKCAQTRPSQGGGRGLVELKPKTDFRGSDSFDNTYLHVSIPKGSSAAIYLVQESNR